MSAITDPQIEQAARHLITARRARRPGPRMPMSCRPTEPEDSLAIQRRVQALLGVSTGGWKCSLPTAERPIACAAIFAPTIFHASPCPVATRGATTRIEPEVAFVLERDLPPRATPYREAEVRAAIAETRLVLEILDSRYADPSVVTFAELLADQVSNQGLFVGPVLQDAWERNLEGFSIALDGPSGALHRRAGRHPDGHPLRPLLWLANFLAGRIEIGGLKAGQIITTGSYAGALEVPVGTRVCVGFGDLGEIRVEFDAA